MARLDWLNTYLPLIVPSFLVGTLGTFMLREFFAGIPDELVEAAVLDGAGTFRIFANIFLPLSVPALTTLFLIAFIHNWNDLLRPVLYISTKSMRTVTIGFTTFQSEYGAQWNLLLAGAVISILPLLIVYISPSANCGGYRHDRVEMNGVPACGTVHGRSAVKLLRCHKGPPVLRYAQAVSFVASIFPEIQLEVVPVTRFNDLLFVPEIIQDVRWMLPGLVNVRVASFMFGRDIRHMAGDLYQLVPPVVGLAHNTLPRLGDVMLKTNDILKSQFLAELGGDLHGLVVYRIAPVETDQRRRTIITGEELCAQQRPQCRIGIVVAHKDRDLELDVNAQPVQQ